MSEAALLVLVGAPRLRLIGLTVPEDPLPTTAPELRLYALLQSNYFDGAHERYNALVRELVSFENAASWALK